MAPTAPPGGEGDDPRRPKKMKSRKNLLKNPARGYAPATTGMGTWTAFRSHVLDAAPLFHPLDIPRMLRDPVVQFGLNQLVGPLTLVKAEVQAKSPEVKGFVENTFKKFWRRAMPLLAFNYFAHGYAPGVHQFDADRDGRERYAGCQWVHPPDARATVYAEGDDLGRLCGFRLSGGVGGGTALGGDDDLIPHPWAAWMGGLQRAGNHYDMPRLASAFTPWLEKNTRCGGLHTRRLYFRTQAFRGQVIYHPDGHLVPGKEESGLNRDYALMIADTLENGTVVVVPDIRTAGDGRNEPAWRVEPIEGNASAALNVLEYVDGLDKEILIGLGIPPELVEAAETGSGFSGRQIPLLAFMTQMDLLTGPLVGCIEPAIRELVNRNYDGAEFTLDTQPLADTVKEMNSPQGTSAVGGMAPAGGAGDGDAPDAAMAGSGGGSPDAGAGGGDQAADAGGDPTAGGLLPYVGRRGGRGKKDPVSGRVYYLSQSGGRTGCLMADIPDPLRAACLSYGRTIDPADLAEDGLEHDPHVTVLHGLTAFEPSAVFAAVAPLGMLSFTPGELRVFENDDHDVLYVACGDERKWQSYHRAASLLPGEPSHHHYVPHLTIAYLKKGRGERYAGDTSLAGGPVAVETLTYAAPDGRESKTAVWPSEAELVEMFRTAA